MNLASGSIGVTSHLERELALAADVADRLRFTLLANVFALHVRTLTGDFNCERRAGHMAVCKLRTVETGD